MYKLYSCNVICSYEGSYFYINNSGEIDKLVSGETKLGEWSALIHHVPLLVVITGSIIFIISFAGRQLIIHYRFGRTMIYITNILCCMLICYNFCHNSFTCNRLHWCFEREHVPPQILFYINASHFPG